MKHLLFIVLLAATVIHARAQNTCTQRLNQAEDDYQSGRLLGIPDRLSICLESGGFSKEEEKRARKLLTLVYIFTDQEREAEAAMINLLKADPEHQLDPQVDPAEIYFLYNQFRVEPVFRIAVRGGFTSSYVHVIRERSTDPGNHPKFYNGKPSRELTGEESELFTSEEGMGIGGFGEVMIERQVFKGLDVALGPQIRFTSYNVEAAVSSPDAESILMKNLTNKQVNFRAPLMLKYTLWHDRIHKRFLPYAFGGGSFDYLLSAGYPNFSRIGGTTYNRTSSDMIATKQVNKVNFSLIGGIGTKFRFKTHFITAEIRYDNSLKAYTNGANAYADQSTWANGAFVEDDLSLDFISISVGATFSVYKPVKLKK